jgi:hypothetical protein
MLVFQSVTHLVMAIVCLISVMSLIISVLRSIMHRRRRPSASDKQDERRCEYWRSIWSYVDMTIIACTCACVGIFIWRYNESKRIANIFRETNGYVYVNLQVAIYVNDVLTCVLAVVCFLASVKFLRLARFHRHLSMFIQTLHEAGKDLLCFLIMFIIVFVAFLILFYLLFSDKMITCASLLHTAQMLFEMILMKFDANELSQSAPVLGPIAFSCFMFLVVFCCLTMFIAIISDTFRLVRQRSKSHPHADHQVFAHIFAKLRSYFGEFVDDRSRVTAVLCV